MRIFGHGLTYTPGVSSRTGNADKVLGRREDAPHFSPSAFPATVGTFSDSSFLRGTFLHTRPLHCHLTSNVGQWDETTEIIFESMSLLTNTFGRIAWHLFPSAMISRTTIQCLRIATTTYPSATSRRFISNDYQVIMMDERSSLLYQPHIAQSPFGIVLSFSHKRMAAMLIVNRLSMISERRLAISVDGRTFDSASSDQYTIGNIGLTQASVEYPVAPPHIFFQLLK
jgi:hypothetical protein